MKKPNSTELIAAGIFFVFLFAALKFITSIDDHEPQATVTSEIPEKKVELTREEKIQRQFSLWDGSHRKLTQTIRQNMNDPDSYEHVETIFAVVGEDLRVQTKYRGKNMYGGKVLGSVTALVDIETGEILHVIESK